MSGGAEAGPAMSGVIYIVVAIAVAAICLGAAIIPGMRQLQKQVTDMARSLGNVEGQMKVLKDATMPPAATDEDQDE